MKNEKELLQAFCGDGDGSRPYFSKPFYDRELGVVCATNCQVLIWAARELVENEYFVLDKPVRIKPVIPEENFQGKVVYLANLQKILDNIPTTTQHTCDECGGNAEVMADYRASNGQMYAVHGDCPICGGKGWVNGEQHKNEKYNVRFETSFFEEGGDFYLAYKYALLLAETMQRLDITEAKILHLSHKKLCVEFQPGLKALFMGRSEDRERYVTYFFPKLTKNQGKQ